MITRDSFGRRSKIEPKDAKAATNELSDAWASIMDARKHLDAAQSSIGLNSKWAGELSMLFRNLNRCSECLEEVVDQIKEIERAKREVGGR